MGRFPPVKNPISTRSLRDGNGKLVTSGNGKKPRILVFGKLVTVSWFESVCWFVFGWAVVPV